MALVLSERGVGSVQEILQMRSDLAMAAWHYWEFRGEWDKTFAALNQKEPTK